MRKVCVVTHGMTGTRLHRIWNGIKGRIGHQQEYISKNIKLCDEWREDFMNFYNWAMSNGYRDDLSIDRIDPYGDYEPSNCRWVDMKVQQNNRTNNTLITIDGVTKTLSNWCSYYNIHPTTVICRMKKGKTPKEALETPVRGHHYLTLNGETKTVAEWSKELHIDFATLTYRAKKGYSDESIMMPSESLKKPSNRKYNREYIGGGNE